MSSFNLPWPPTVNHYWIRGTQWGGKRGMRLSDDAKMFRQKAFIAIRRDIPRGWTETRGHWFWLTINVYPPDNRRRDLDNILKPVLDVLTHSRVYEDDYYVRGMTIMRCEVTRDGVVVVDVKSLGAVE